MTADSVNGQTDCTTAAEQLGDFSATVDRNIDGYFVEHLLGHGGMGTVYRARRISDGTRVALKLLHSNSAAQATSRQRFRREVKAIGSLKHEHIVPLYSAGEHFGRSYLAMKLIDGVTLADVREQSDQFRTSIAGATPRDASTPADTAPELVTEDLSIDLGGSLQFSPPSQHSAIQCFERACGAQNYFRGLAGLLADAADALHAAHQQNIVHRDVKPSNLLLDATGKLWLTDFGLASLGDDQTAVTGTGDVLGTPAYMSPEQAIGAHHITDRRTDIYSLGATLYELATLHRPYGGNRHQVLTQVMRGEFPAPSRRRPDTPPAMEAIILTAMAKHPAERYQTAAELALDLRRFAAGLPVRARIRSVADKAARLIAYHPRQSALATLGVTAVITVIILSQYLSGLRLESHNRELAEANATLEQVNADLAISQSRLQHHVYVADVAAAYRAYGNRDQDAAVQLLRRHFPHADKPDRRRMEWWLLHHLTRTPHALQFHTHEGPVREARYVPSRGEVVSSGDDGTVRRWDAVSGRVKGVHRIGGKLDALAVSADGRWMVTGQNIPFGTNPVAIRDLETGEISQVLTGHEHSVEAAAFSPDGRWIVTAGRYRDVLLHASDGRLAGRLTTGSRNEAVAFSPDGRTLATLTQVDTEGRHDHGVALWSVPSLERQRDVSLPCEPTCLELSQDGNWMVVGGNDDLAVVHLASEAVLEGSDCTRGNIRCVAISDHAGNIVAGCDNGLLYLWQLGELAATSLAGHALPSPTVIATGTEQVTSVHFVDDRTVLSSTRAGLVQIWDTSQVKNRIREIDCSATALGEPVADGNGLLLLNRDGEIVRLDWRTLEATTFPETASEGFTNFAIAPDDRTLVATDAGKFVVMSLPSGKIVRRFDAPKPDHRVRDLCFLPDAKTCLVLHDNFVSAYDVAEDCWAQPQGLAAGGADRLLLSPDGQTVVVSANKKLMFLDSGTRSLTATVPSTYGDFTGAMAFAEEGLLLAAGLQDGTVLVMDANPQRANRAEPLVLRGHHARVNQCRFLEQDQTLVTIASDDTVRFWDISSGRELGVLDVGTGNGNHLAHDPVTHRLLTTGPRGTARIWSTSPAQR